MTAPRIDPLDPPFDAEVAAEFERIMPAGVAPLNLFRTLARNTRVTLRVLRGGLLDRGSIAIRDREIVILRATARCGSEYEWGVHVAFFGERIGLSEAQIVATAADGAEDPAWSAQDRLLIRLVDALHDESRVGDELWRDLTEHWSDEQLVELIVLTGQYHTISFVTNALGVALEDYGARFPAAAG